MKLDLEIPDEYEFGTMRLSHNGSWSISLSPKEGGAFYTKVGFGTTPAIALANCLGKLAKQVVPKSQTWYNEKPSLNILDFDLDI